MSFRSRLSSGRSRVERHVRRHDIKYLIGAIAFLVVAIISLVLIGINSAKDEPIVGPMPPSEAEMFLGENNQGKPPVKAEPDSVTIPGYSVSYNEHRASIVTEAVRQLRSRSDIRATWLGVYYFYPEGRFDSLAVKYNLANPSDEIPFLEESQKYNFGEMYQTKVFNWCILTQLKKGKSPREALYWFESGTYQPVKISLPGIGPDGMTINVNSELFAKEVRKIISVRGMLDQVDFDNDRQGGTPWYAKWSVKRMFTVFVILVILVFMAGYAQSRVRSLAKKRNARPQWSMLTAFLLTATLAVVWLTQIQLPIAYQINPAALTNPVNLGIGAICTLTIGLFVIGRD